MKKFLFIGAKEELAQFFVDAQKEGFIEFISAKKRGKEQPEAVKQIMDAIKILRHLPYKEPTYQDQGLAAALEITHQVLGLKKEIEKLSEEKRILEAEISRVAPFGQFSFDDIAFIEKYGKKKIQFYCVKTSKAHEIHDPHLIYVGTDYDLDYYIGIHDKLTTYPGMIEMHFDRTADELKNHLAFVEETLRQVEAELKGFAGHLEFLREELLELLDIHNLERAEQEVNYPIPGAVFSVEAWVPENKMDKLSPLIEGKALFFEPIAVEPDEKVPTYMENRGTARIGEDLILLYDVPAATDKDPSIWVVWSFIFFFAMIIADAGYGLLFLGLAFFVKKKFPKMNRKGKRLLKLFFLLASASIIWGVLITSFFGIQFAPHNPLTKVSITHYLAVKKIEYHRAQNDKVYQEYLEKYPEIEEATTGEAILQSAQAEKEGKTVYPIVEDFSGNILLELAIIVGIIHICLSLARYAGRNWANVGWIAFAIGGYFYFPIFLKTTSMVEYLGLLSRHTLNAFGFELLLIGIGGAVVLALIQKRLKGLGEIMQMVQVFADILSYLRLYALALASAIMAATFNDMGRRVGLVFGILIVLAGHAVNLLLSAQSGVIHGLRLNFLEWYHFSYEGNGKLFNPLRRLKVKKELR